MPNDLSKTAPVVLDYQQVRELSLLEEMLRGRRPSLPFVLLFVGSAVAIALALYHLFVAAYGTPEGRSFRTTHLSGMLVLAILLNPLGRADFRAPLGGLRARLGFAVDLVLVAFVLFVQVYTVWDIEAFHLRFGEREPRDLWIGFAFTLLVLECTRRAVGLAMVCVAAFFVLQTLYTPWFPGFLYGPPTSFAKYMDTTFMSSEGIFGIPLHVCSTYIVLFIIFGAVLIRSGAGRFFIDLAVALTGHRTGGPAKASVVASAFMGTVSGSAVANVVTTGSFTIPLMKRLGYRAKFAAAVEACASSGGQITPPIMGAAAFIIAEFLQVSYLWVIVAAAIPAFLYFATIYFMVHLEAEKHGIERVPKSQLPRLGEVWKGGWHLMLSLIVLVGFLVAGFTPMLAAFWSLITLIALSFISANTRMSAVDLFAALELGVRSTMPVTVACACAGIIIGSVFVSGLGLKFTQSVISMAGGELFVLLVLTALAAILLGMGMTTTAVYITVAALIVPSLEKIGVAPVAAHMYAFYFGVVSSITPPVALAAFAGAAIARTPPMSTAVESSRVGIAKYLVPIVFVYNSSLLFEGALWLTAYSTVTVLAGLWVLSSALEGWFHGPLGAPGRLLAAALAVCLLWPPETAPLGVPGFALNVAGAALLAVFYVLRAGLPFRRRAAG